MYVVVGDMREGAKNTGGHLPELDKHAPMAENGGSRRYLYLIYVDIDM